MKTATNKQTGERIFIDDEGNYIPIEASATNPETQQKIFKINGQWIPADQDIAPRTEPNLARTRSGWKNTERGNLNKRAQELGVTGLFEPTPSDDMTGFERFYTAADKAAEDIPTGLNQLAQHLMPGKDTSAIDEKVSEREKYYRLGGLADTTGGQAGAVTGGIAAFGLPGGLGVKAAERVLPHVPKVIAPFIEGGLAGGMEGAAMPVAGDDYWSDKGGQVLWGAGLGGGANTGMQALLRGSTGARNLPTRAKNAPANMLESANQGPLAIPATANRQGIDLTLGQATGNRPMQFMEQRARESFVSSGRVAEGDLIRAQQLNDAVKRLAGDSTTPVTGRELQTRVQGHVQDLFTNRSKHGRKMYGEIDNFARDVYETRKIIKADNTIKELEAIIAEAGTQEGGDVVKQAAYAQKMLDTLAKQEGRYSAQEALGRLQTHSPYSKAKVAGTEGFGYDQVLKGRIYSALMKDMSAAESLGGNLGDMVKQANKTWRGFTEQIDSVKGTIFGRMMGKEFGEGAITANTVSPAKVIKSIAKMDYSEANDLMGFMADNMPDMVPKVRGSILNDAIDAALMGPPSGGAEFMFNPNQFQAALGLRAGTAGVEGMKRLEAIFGKGTREWADMQQLIEISRRMGDAYGKNFSGTSQATSFLQMLKDFSSLGVQAAKRIGATGLEFAGLRKIANSMTPGSIDFGNIQPRPLIQPPRITQPASSYAGVVAPALADER